MIKFNSGMGGVICDRCRKLIASGKKPDLIYNYQIRQENHLVVIMNVPDVEWDTQVESSQKSVLIAKELDFCSWAHLLDYANAIMDGQTPEEM